jgi:pimeloyl-ACP methyl ester carboxylesterase
MPDVSGPTRWKSSRCQKLDIRGVRYNLRKWGDDSDPPILMLHGTRDSSITFQFVVEHLTKKWCVFAPDWRGHGHSGWVRQGYWFHEFVADLDAILDAIGPGHAIPVVGHSMGGNVASIFAGLRPTRLARLILLDAFGPAIGIPVDVQRIFETYLQQATVHYSRGYEGVAEVAGRLEKANGRLTKAQALFLAEHNTRLDRYGMRRWLFDPCHQRSLPTLRTMEEWAQIWSGIRVPVYLLSSDERSRALAKDVGHDLDARLKLMPGARRLTVAATGHNLHHDAPDKIAAEIEDFLSSPGTLIASPIL